jgi:cell division protein FtsL
MRTFFVIVVFLSILGIAYIIISAPVDEGAFTNDAVIQQRSEFEEDYGDLGLEQSTYTSGVASLRSDINNAIQRVRENLGLE